MAEKNGTKITILGAGNVGASIAYTFAVAGTCSDIVLVDINKAKAKGEAMDIRQGVSFGENVEIFDGEYEDAKDSDIVVVTLGIARKPGQTRLDLAQINVNIIKEVMPQIAKYAPDAMRSLSSKTTRAVFCMPSFSRASIAWFTISSPIPRFLYSGTTTTW